MEDCNPEKHHPSYRTTVRKENEKKVCNVEGERGLCCHYVWFILCRGGDIWSEADCCWYIINIQTHPAASLHQTSGQYPTCCVTFHVSFLNPHTIFDLQP